MTRVNSNTPDPTFFIRIRSGVNLGYRDKSFGLGKHMPVVNVSTENMTVVSTDNIPMVQVSAENAPVVEVSTNTFLWD